MPKEHPLKPSFDFLKKIGKFGKYKDWAEYRKVKWGESDLEEWKMREIETEKEREQFDYALGGEPEEKDVKERTLWETVN